MSEAAGVGCCATNRTTARAFGLIDIPKNRKQLAASTPAKLSVIPILLSILIVSALPQTLRAQPFAELWPGTSIDINSCFTNHQYVVENRGMLLSSVTISPIRPGKLNYFCFTAALGPGYVGVFTVKVAAQAYKFRAGAFAIVDEPGRKPRLGHRLLRDRLVQQSRQRRGRMLVITPDHSKPRRFALVMGTDSTRHGRVILSFHAVNPLWQSMRGGGQALLAEGLAQFLAAGAGATGPAAEMTAALTQLAINAIMSGNSDDSTNFIVSGLAGVAPHLNKHIPALGTTWMAQTYVNIRNAMYKGFDRRYRLPPK